MTTNLSDIDSQPLSTLVAFYLTCKSCGVVDSDSGRSRTGHPCSTCLEVGEGGRLAFPISIHVLVDLVQQAYHSASQVGPEKIAPQGENIGTLLYFCALREALLNWFLLGNLRAQQLPTPIVDKLFSDNKLAAEKLNSLFPAVVGVKWNEALASIASQSDPDTKRLDQLMREAAQARNAFMHEGVAWGVDRAFATRCIDALAELTYLFVELHNLYTHPLLWRAGADSSKSAS